MRIWLTAVAAFLLGAAVTASAFYLRQHQTHAANAERAVRLAEDRLAAEALDHLNDALMHPLAPAWDGRPLNIACQSVLVDKHLAKYPHVDSTRWTVARAELRHAGTAVADLSDSQRIVANACAEQAVSVAARELAASATFERR